MKVLPHEYMHPEDRVALDNLNALPLFPAALKAFMKLVTEELLQGVNMAQKIRLGPQQLPELYQHLPPICQKLGITEPELYLEMDPQPNAYTFGDTKTFVTITSGLVESLDEDEIQAVIAHECGHIACHHVLYHTMASLLLRFGASSLGLTAAVAMPIMLALLHWQRRSELSADRAAAVALMSPDGIVQTMIRLAGGPRSITDKVNLEVYLQQADVYSKSLEESLWDRVLQGYAVMNSNHPFIAVRAREIINWSKTEQYRRIVEALRVDLRTPKCRHCGQPVENAWDFCRYCGARRN